MNHPEHDEQKKFFELINALEKLGSIEAALTFAVPNAAKRSPKLAAYMKAEGMKSGVPDIICAFPRAGYNGLVIEMKIKPNKVEDNQKAFLQKLSGEGWLVKVCWSAGEAYEEWCNYILGKENKMKIVCVDCGLDMVPARIGVEAIDMFLTPPQPYKITTGDMMRCPGCGHKILAGFAACSHEHFLPDFQKYLEVAKKNRAIVVWERIGDKERYGSK